MEITGARLKFDPTDSEQGVFAMTDSSDFLLYSQNLMQTTHVLKHHFDRLWEQPVFLQL